MKKKKPVFLEAFDLLLFMWPGGALACGILATLGFLIAPFSGRQFSWLAIGAIGASGIVLSYLGACGLLRHFNKSMEEWS